MFLRLKLDKITQLINVNQVQTVVQRDNQVCIVFARGKIPLMLTMVSTAMAQRLVRKFQQKS